MINQIVGQIYSVKTFYPNVTGVLVEFNLTRFNVCSYVFLWWELSDRFDLDDVILMEDASHAHYYHSSGIPLIVSLCSCIN